MVQPRNIVYPVNFVTPWLAGDEQSESVFTKQLARILGDDSFIIPLGRARTGLYLLVKNALTPTRSRVIMSPYTIADVVNMVRFAGGQPVFVDFVPNSTNVDIDHLGTLVDDRTACVLLTHYHVSQAKTLRIVELCRERGVKLFDDCAICLGASFMGRPIGTLTDASVFSLSGFKILNFIWGGFIATKDAEQFRTISKEVASWPRLHARQYLTMGLEVFKYKVLTNPMVFPLAFGVRSRLVQKGEIKNIIPRALIETRSLDETILSRPSVSALAEWNRKFGEIPVINAHRRAIAAIYDKTFRNISVSAETDDAVRATSSFWHYPIIVGADKREHIYREVLRRGFDVGLMLYPNVHETEPYAMIEGRSSNVSILARSMITLPTHVRVTASYAERLAACVADVLA
jgi:perosamine synthetase